MLKETEEEIEKVIQKQQRLTSKADELKDRAHK